MPWRESSRVPLSLLILHLTLPALQDWYTHSLHSRGRKGSWIGSGQDKAITVEESAASQSCYCSEWLVDWLWLCIFFLQLFCCRSGEALDHWWCGMVTGQSLYRLYTSCSPCDFPSFLPPTNHSMHGHRSPCCNSLPCKATKLASISRDHFLSVQFISKLLWGNRSAFCLGLKMIQWCPL